MARILALALMASLLGGCAIVPLGYGYDGDGHRGPRYYRGYGHYYDGDRDWRDGRRYADPDRGR